MKPVKFKKLQNKDWLSIQLSFKTIKTIAEELGCSVQTVLRWKEIHKITRKNVKRNREEAGMKIFKLELPEYMLENILSIAERECEDPHFLIRKAITENLFKRGYNIFKYEASEEEEVHV